MQRWHEPTAQDAEFPGWDFLDEARFSGGRERNRNRKGACT